ncbi:MAG TPA: helix-turn-helix domain-containing protein [Usitatibacter sp.]|nr:helix-turn-helix domain-containing protein [Usitatibacter sp.]
MSAAGRPRIPERAEAQRTRILDAAQKCFIEQGFHAASMATIAETAQMSAGLIYRYFESKHAIVLAIIARELGRSRERIAALHTCVDLTSALLDAFRDLKSVEAMGMNAALHLETSAEATRVTEIGAAVRDADAQTRAEFAAFLMRPVAEGGLGMGSADAQRRALAMQIIVGGLVLRAARTPGVGARELRQALEPLVATLVGEPAPAA